MSEMMDGIVARAIQELERQKQDAAEIANRVVERAKHALETINQAGERDVFNEALVVAVGECSSFSSFKPGEAIWCNFGGTNLSLTVSKSERTEAKVTQERNEFQQKHKDWSKPPTLRAVLVIFEDRPPIGKKS